MINHITILLLVYSSLFLGATISKFTKEEMKPGKLFFNIILKLLPLFLVTILFLFKNIKVSWFLLGLLIGLILPLTYLYFGLIITSFWQEPTLLILTSSIIFLYGLTKGTLSYSEEKIKKKTLFATLIFISIIPGIFLTQLITHNITISIITGLIFSSTELKKIQIKSFFLK